MTGPDIIVREMGPGDVPSALRLRSAAWRESYRGVVPDAVLAGLEHYEPVIAAEWRTFFRRGATGWLAFLDGELAGVALARPTDTGAAAPIDLQTLYVLAHAQGRGLGRRLVEAAVGGRACEVWVIEGNETGAAFYEHLGFARDGVRKEISPVFRGVGEFRMVRAARPRSLDPLPPSSPLT